LDFEPVVFLLSSGDWMKEWLKWLIREEYRSPDLKLLLCLKNYSI
jgi:hypothetical protein